MKNKKDRTAEYGVLTALWVVMLVAVDNVLGMGWLESEESFLALLCELVTVIFMSLSLSLNLRCQRFDFSLGAVAMLSPMLAWHICDSLWPGFFLSCFFGGLLSFCTCGVHLVFKMSPELSSLCLALIYEGAAQMLSTTVPPSSVLSVDDVTVLVIGCIFTVAAIYAVLEKSPFGYDYRAICHDHVTAERSGVDMQRNTVTVFVISGVLMGGVGVLLRSGIDGEVSGIGFSSVRILFFALLPIFIGRLLERGCSHVTGIVLGAVISATFYSYTAHIGLPYYSRVLVTSLTVFLLLLFLSNEKRLKKALRVDK